MSKDKDSDDRIRWAIRKRKVYMTDSLRGYLSQEGTAALKRLIDVGIDKDLAFSMLESWVKEEDLYNLPGDEDDGS